MAPHPWRPNKRQRRDDASTSSRALAKPEQVEIPKFAYIQAYEANLVYPSSASASASDLGTGSRPSHGRSLIKWAGEWQDATDTEDAPEIWADRYDIIHLLPSLPHPHPTGGRATSPTGSASSSSSESSTWDNVPSDEEALFDMSGDEAVAEYQREKRKRWVEKLREERLKGIAGAERLEDADDLEDTAVAVEEDTPPHILSLMKHTALSLYKSPNPTQLESKILAHHTSDARFAFLRAKDNSRLKREWDKAKYEAKVELGIIKQSRAVGLNIGGLGGYGSSDSETDEEGEGEGEGEGQQKRKEDDDLLEGKSIADDTGVAPTVAQPEGTPPPPPPPPPPEDDETTFPPPPPPSDVPNDQVALPSENGPQDQDAKAELKRKQAERKVRAAAWKAEKALKLT